ncbi:MAG: protoheme IX farnesyltransferase [Phycisphaerales bacterium]|nr:protoheme IX farnesyltransferase [Phycisphaerales bacterium]
MSRVAPAQTAMPPLKAPVEVPSTAAEGSGAASWRDSLRAYVHTTKPGITKLVTITSMVGLGMALAARWAAGDREWALWPLSLTVVGSIVGTAMSAGGANALNQWAERERDALMKRTAGRPLPTGALTPGKVLLAGIGLALAGLALLWATCGLAAMAVSAACVLVYVLLYTPLKASTWTATFVGAVPGALPPLIGWCAGYSHLGFGALGDPGGASLFLLMFVWQLPHFLAIAWMFKDDYALGGCAVLPVVDRSGACTSIVIAICTVLLIPATMAPVLAMPQVLGVLSLFTAALTGLGFAALVGRLLRSRRREDARSVFFASIIHLPVLLVVMVIDAFVHTIL